MVGTGVITFHSPSPELYCPARICVQNSSWHEDTFPQKLFLLFFHSAVMYEVFRQGKRSTIPSSLRSRSEKQSSAYRMRPDNINLRRIGAPNKRFFCAAGSFWLKKVELSCLSGYLYFLRRIFMFMDTGFNLDAGFRLVTYYLAIKRETYGS